MNIQPYSGTVEPSLFAHGGYLHYEITRKENENQDFARLEKFFTQLQKAEKTACQHIFLSFDGYEKDKRELIAIPSVVTYTKEMFHRFPYYHYYAAPVNSMILVTALLKKDVPIAVMNPDFARIGVRVTPESVEWLIDNMKTNVHTHAAQFSDKKGAEDALDAWFAVILNMLHSIK